MFNKRATRLRLENLEPRVVPAAVTIDERFDGTAVGKLPDNFASWNSSGSPAAFAVVNTAVDHTPQNALRFTPPGGAAGRFWSKTGAPADAVVTAAAWVSGTDSYKDYEVVARGADLGTTTPDYYSLGFRRGGNGLTLSKVVDGAAPVVLDRQPTGWTSNLWVELSLRVVGNQVQGQARKLDGTYLQEDGSWSAAPAWAVSATDASIPGGGFAGVARPAGGTAADFDTFSVTSLAAEPPPPANIVVVTQADLDRGQYALNQAGKTYQLAANVTALDTAFVVAAPDVTLDLNGKTLTYNARPAPKTRAGEALNGGFELARSSTDTSPRHWDLSAAPGAQRLPVAGNRFGFFGDHFLRVPLTQAAKTKTVLSDEIDLPANPADASRPLAREFAVTVTAMTDTSDRAKLTVEVVDSNNVVLGTASRVGHHMVNGYGTVVSFKPTTKTVRIRMTAELVKGTSEVVDIDYVELRAHREYGVVASQTSTEGYSPRHVLDTPGRASIRNFTLRDGSSAGTGKIVQGAGQGISSHPVALQSLEPRTGLTLIDNVETHVSGVGTSNVGASHVHGDLAVRKSLFTSAVDHVPDRTGQLASVFINHSKGDIQIADNEIRDFPQTGVFLHHLMGNDERILIDRNTIRQHARVTNGYGVAILGATKFSVSDNTILPVLGRGILLDGSGQDADARDGLIRNNQVLARERPNREYPLTRPRSGNNVEATALRIRDYDEAFHDLIFTGNTFAAETDSAGTWAAIGARISLTNTGGAPANSNIQFVGNTFSAVVKTANTAYYGMALSVSQMAGDAEVLFRDNRYVGNHRLINFGDNDSSGGQDNAAVMFVGNRYVRPTDAPDRTTVADARETFWPVVQGDWNVPVKNVSFSGDQFDAAVPAERRRPKVLS